MRRFLVALLSASLLTIPAVSAQSSGPCIPVQLWALDETGDADLSINNTTLIGSVDIVRIQIGHTGDDCEFLYISTEVVEEEMEHFAVASGAALGVSPLTYRVVVDAVDHPASADHRFEFVYRVDLGLGNLTASIEDAWVEFYIDDVLNASTESGDLDDMMSNRSGGTLHVEIDLDRMDTNGFEGFDAVAQEAERDALDALGASGGADELASDSPFTFGVGIGQLIADVDGDGLADVWELFYFDDLNQTASGDPDGDGLANLDEQAAGTDPDDEDSDGDGHTDENELDAGTDPLDSSSYPGAPIQPDPEDESDDSSDEGADDESSDDEDAADDPAHDEPAESKKTPGFTVTVMLVVLLAFGVMVRRR